MRVPPLVRELRPQMPCVVAKKVGEDKIKISFLKKKKRNTRIWGTKITHTHTQDL